MIFPTFRSLCRCLNRVYTTLHNKPKDIGSKRRNWELRPAVVGMWGCVIEGKTRAFEASAFPMLLCYAFCVVVVAAAASHHLCGVEKYNALERSVGCHRHVQIDGKKQLSQFASCVTS